MVERDRSGIDYFNRDHWLTGIQTRVSIGARRRMFDRWRAYAGPLAGQTVLDVGATPDRERIDSNCMLPWLHEVGARVALYSPEDISNLREAFPWADLLPSQGFGAPIPAPAAHYDWVTSSAVIEHVGGAAQQIEFLRDCARAARGLFLTTPDRHHWFEFHTKLPLLHWMPRPWHRAALRRLGHTTWAQESHLRLVSGGELRDLAQAALGDDFDFEIQRIWTLGMPSNLILLARRRALA
jgi:hypothetical protein